MKKRILIVQPLLSLALISSSALWGMETPKPTALDAKSENERQIDQLIAEVTDMKLVTEATADTPKKVMSPEEAKHREKFSTVVNVMRAFTPDMVVVNKKIVVNDSDKVRFKSIKQKPESRRTISSLNASVIEPVFYSFDLEDEEELSLFGFITNTLTNKFSNAKLAVLGATTSVINYLASNSFDPQDASHMDLLHTALLECKERSDLISLEKIITGLNKDQYCGVRFSNDNSKTVFAYLSELYAQQAQKSKAMLDVSNIENAKKLNEESLKFKTQMTALCEAQKNTLISLAKAHDADIKKEQGKLDKIQTLMIGFSQYNKPIRYAHIGYCKDNGLHDLTNSIEDIRKESEVRLSRVITQGSMPTINTDILTLQAQKNTRTKAILPAPDKK